MPYKIKARLPLHNVAQYDIFNRKPSFPSFHTQEHLVPTNPEPLRKAIQQTGLTADIQSPLAVSARLVQVIFSTLEHSAPKAAQKLTQALHELAEPDECNLLLEGRSFTYLHVVQYLYGLAETHHQRPNPHPFPVEVGRNGGGLIINPETDILSLTQLLVSALPHNQDNRNIGLLVQALSPMMLDKIYPGNLFRVQSEFVSDQELAVTLSFADRNLITAELAKLGLIHELGLYFHTVALQVQGTIQLGLRTFSQRIRDVRISPSLERQPETYCDTVQQACQHTWTISWRPEVSLRRTETPDNLMEQVRTIYDTLHRRDMEYFQERIKTLESRLEELEGGFHDLIGNSPAIRRVYETIQQVADTDLTVLIRGDSGTGKELVARALHASSSRRNEPFVAVNCAAFSESLLETELFGHDKGAFTGADKTKPGRFERANGGTLFLDEAGDIPLPTQIKLLRMLESREYERVGGTESLTADVRIVAATNRDLEALIADGSFREDFYYRLNVLPVYLPPLRERIEDIPPIASHFLSSIATRTNATPARISRGGIDRLLAHTWPGNVRELQHVIERAVAVYARGRTITADHIEHALGVQTPRPTTSTLNVRQQEILDLIHQSAQACIVDDLIAQAQSLSTGMGTSRRTLQNDLRKLTDMGYLSWQKRGSARTYALTPRAIEIVSQ